MWARCLGLALLLCLVYAFGCSNGLAPERETSQSQEDGSIGEPCDLTSEPRPEKKSWSELKQEFADRLPKDTGK